MSMTQARKHVRMRTTRTFAVPRARLFEAWTKPDELKKWWQLGHGWKLTIAEIDLKVGGRYKIGLNSTKGNTKHLVTGTYQEVSVPEKLVYTWTSENHERGEQSLVTVEFHDKGGSTELVLTHDLLVNKQEHETTYEGWLMVLDGLRRMFESDPHI